MESSGSVLKSVFEDDFAVVELAGAGPRILGFLSDGDHEGNDVVAREVQDFAHGLVVEAVHRAGIIAEFLRCEHERLASHAARTHGFVTLHLRFSRVILSNGGNEKVLNGFGGIAPVLGWVLFPRREIRAKDNEERGIGDLGLIPCHSADLFANFHVLHNHKTPVLDIEGRWGKHGELEELALHLLWHLVGGIVVFDSAAPLDGFNGVHVRDRLRKTERNAMPMQTFFLGGLLWGN